MVEVVSLRIQPIKACGIIELNEAMLTPRGLARGFVGDRRYALIDENNVVITQRKNGHSNGPGRVRDYGNPELTLVHMSLVRIHGRTTGFTATVDGYGSIAIDARKPIYEPVTITLHGKTTTAGLTHNADADKWFSEYLKRPVRLVEQSNYHIRHCDPNFAHDLNHDNSLGDGFQVLVTTMPSLRGLNALTSRPFSMDNFRPNIVLDGDFGDHAENGWGAIDINGAMLELVKPCTRCEVTTIDLKTGEQPKMPGRSEPWATLKQHWAVDYKVGGKVMDGEPVKETHVFGPVFGENGMPTRDGLIRVGDRVSVLNTKPAPQWVRLVA